MRFDLGRLGAEVIATAEADGWTLHPAPGVAADLSRRASWPAGALGEPGGVSAALQVETLVELGLAEAANSCIVVPWERFGDVMREGIRLPLQWTSWSPLMLAIDRISEIGRPDFRYKYAYRAGLREVAVDRIGYFLHRRSTGELFHLDEQTFSLVDAMDRFNDLPGQEKTAASSWLAFGHVKGCSAAVGATLDAYLRSNDVLVPSQIALDIFVHDDETISFVPQAPGIPDREFREAFLSHRDVQGLYVIDADDGRRIRVVLNERHREVLERMKQVRRFRGEAREQALRNPAQFFDGLLDAVEIRYGPRVIGIGDLPHSLVPSIGSRRSEFFDGVPRAPGQSDEAASDHHATVTLSGVDGGEDVQLLPRDHAAVVAARDAIAEAIARGDRSAVVEGKRVIASPEVLATLDAPQVDSVESGERAGGRKFLLVYTNEQDLRDADTSAVTRASAVPADWPRSAQLPRSLATGVGLKPHQQESLLWMQRCESIVDRRGVLLADDMGLGKTLQILAFLASRIEAHHLGLGNSPDDGPPWRPILIVAPLILVENETWRSEMGRFFARDGDVFKPVLVLHGTGIDEVRLARSSGGETSVGRPTLSADRLMQYRTVITNYETVVRYQHSLAQLKDGRPLWSAIVTDEAQKYKAMNSQISTALKAIGGDFHIASTGTPVENRLLDLWNIMDAIQPALLGTASEFTSEYERKIGGDAEEKALAALRSRLLFQEPNAFVLRRSKQDILTELPQKRVELLRCQMTSAEQELHAQLIGALSGARAVSHHLAILHKLTQLYQHPALLRGDWDRTPVADLVAESPKLVTVIRQLREIRRRGEKAIIFARNLDAQQLLARVFEDEFHQEVAIINGMTSKTRGVSSSSAFTARAKNERKRILDAFRSQPGFAAIILSPFVAGIGLTITEANHVIHYGRWWNPAVEAQATDRVYRIGQTRPVAVYLPILYDATGRIARSFDECLHDLLTQKADLAHDFLHPADAEDHNASELWSMLGQDGSRADAASMVPFTAADLDRLDPADFEAAVAALYAARGYGVVLTAKGSDGGVDVLAFRPGEAILIQVKHSRRRQPIDARALNDVIGGCDVYRGHISARWKPVVVSNAPMDAETAAEAQRLGIDLVPGERLRRMMSDARVGLGATVAMAALRCRSFDDGIQQARALVNELRAPAERSNVPQ